MMCVERHAGYGAGLTSADEVDQQLLAAYMQQLDIDDLSQLALDETKGALSGLFLPAASEEYLRSDVRVMLVGKEPRSWGRSISHLISSDRSTTALRDYVCAQMQYHRAEANKRAGRSKFLQFRSRLQASVSATRGKGQGSVAWANLLCVSLNRRSARFGKTGDRIALLSRKLLKVQLELLAPDVVVFGSGYHYDGLIKDLFDQDYTNLPGIVPKEFWPFEARGQTIYRVAHPQSHTRKEAQRVLSAVRGYVNSRRGAGSQPDAGNGWLQDSLTVTTCPSPVFSYRGGSGYRCDACV